jgi:protein-tyrosine kinase
MSLIERALTKATSPSGYQTSTDTGATSSRLRAMRVPPSRVVLEPLLKFQPEMLENLGLQSPEEQEHQRISEYRDIKRHVLNEIRANAASRVVLVTSALAGEGKSFSSANLARSLALEPDFSVLLIDADVIKPHISRVTNLIDRPGLMNALTDMNCDVESMVVTTDIEGLSILPAGSANQSATEYLSSDRMRALLDDVLRVPNRIVVVDSLPLLITTEARSLAPLAGQVLLVVRAESTPRAAVRQAIELLDEEVNVKVVLNGVAQSKVARYLGYGYGFDKDYARRIETK